MTRFDRYGETELILLGTGGGPVWWPGTARMGIGSAVRVGDAVYVVDCGAGSARRLKESAIAAPTVKPSGGLWGLENLRAIFLTHLHSDHLADLPSYLLFGWTNGLRDRADSGDPVTVYGPGARVDAAGTVVMEPVFSLPGPRDAASEVEIECADAPVPGTSEMFEALYRAFALDINDRMRDNGFPSLRRIFAPRDIVIPSGIGYHPNGAPSPAGMEPFEIFADDRVRVSATLVDHHQIAPAFGFRFETDAGSVVFSGDTSGPNENLIRLARGSDILVHEVIRETWVDALFPSPHSPQDSSLRNHLLEAHTRADDAARVAAAADVRTLVFSHIAPGNSSDEELAISPGLFDGKVLVGHDLMRIPLAP